MGRMKLTTDPITGYVTITWTDDDGDKHSLTLSAPRRVGYVHIVDDPDRPQICEMLYSRGNTLRASRETLPSVVRREWRRRRRHEARQNKKEW